MSILKNVVLQAAKETYRTSGGIVVTRSVEPLSSIDGVTDHILANIDTKRGALFSSSYEYPGRYSRWDIGFVDPAVELRAVGREFVITALNGRGEVLLPALQAKLEAATAVVVEDCTPVSISGTVPMSEEIFYEEERSRQATLFTLVREIRDLFSYGDDSFLGLYGAFGYDLVFQFEPMELRNLRAPEQADMVLYLPDQLTIVDHQMALAFRLSYEFQVDGRSTEGLARETASTKRESVTTPEVPAYEAGRYAGVVRQAMDGFRRGDMFEVVPTQSIYEACPDAPSEVFRRLVKINPSPYCFIVNLGREFLVGSSPEMYVRVEGDRVETCPISGTIKRGADAIEDADRIRELLNSKKDESELTMCTDVDRNDKSRICLPGSVKVIGRRQTEMYSHLIHTVDHVEGRLSAQYDSLDAFITHMWAVTITGAPKRAAVRWIETNENKSREWYGGAVGYLAFNGDLNTGLTLRTIKIQDGLAEIRVGATVLYDSIPEAEEEETLTKANALVQAIRGPKAKVQRDVFVPEAGRGKRVLFVDHEDSFVHTLANYFKQTGADVVTLRSPFARKVLAKGEETFDLVVLSPGPGRPEEFKLKETIGLCVGLEIPVFGVCLGLQGIVEAFGGSLNYLEEPRHGKPRHVDVVETSSLWEGIPEAFDVGLYHSIFAEVVPEELKITAVTDDGIVMAVEHRSLPISAVQFHPESIMTARQDIGLKIVNNALRLAVKV